MKKYIKHVYNLMSYHKANSRSGTLPALLEAPLIPFLNAAPSLHQGNAKLTSNCVDQFVSINGIIPHTVLHFFGARPLSVLAIIALLFLEGLNVVNHHSQDPETPFCHEIGPLRR